jgi:hypothetical protein
MIANWTAPEFRARHVGDLAENIPQREINARDRCGTNDAVAMPEVLTMHHLPEMFDACRIFTNQQLR